MRYVAEGVVRENPTGRIEGLEAFRQFAHPVRADAGRPRPARRLRRRRHRRAGLQPGHLVADAPSAERFTVRDGRIVHDLLIFDRTPFDEARRRAG